MAPYCKDLYTIPGSCKTSQFLHGQLTPPPKKNQKNKTKKQNCANFGVAFCWGRSGAHLCSVHAVWSAPWCAAPVGWGGLSWWAGGFRWHGFGQICHGSFVYVEDFFRCLSLANEKWEEKRMKANSALHKTYPKWVVWDYYIILFHVIPLIKDCEIIM